MLFGFIMAIMIVGGGVSSPMPNYYWDNYAEIYCEDLDPMTPPGNCQHREDFSDAIFWYEGEIVSEHDDSIMPEDCSVTQIEQGNCKYGFLP